MIAWCSSPSRPRTAPPPPGRPPRRLGGSTPSGGMLQGPTYLLGFACWSPLSTLAFPDSSISSVDDEIDHLNAPRFAASAHLAISLLRNSPSFSGGPPTKR